MRSYARLTAALAAVVTFVLFLRQGLVPPPAPFWPRSWPMPRCGWFSSGPPACGTGFGKGAGKNAFPLGGRRPSAHTGADEGAAGTSVAGYAPSSVSLRLPASPQGEALEGPSLIPNS